MKLVLIFLSMFLASCIDGEEEISLHADGSGSLKVVYRVPAVLLSEEDGDELEESIQSGVADNPHLKIITNEVTRDEGYQVITIEVGVDDVMALRKYQPVESNRKPNETIDAIVGNITVKLQGLSVNIHRDLDLAVLLRDKFGDKSLSSLGDSEFRYTLNLPKPAKEHNAHVVSNHGTTLHWVYKLADTATVPISIDVVAAVPIPWWIYLCGSGGLLVAVLIICHLLKKNHQEKRAA